MRMTLRSMRLAAGALALATVAFGCSSDPVPSVAHFLDRPTAVAFACAQPGADGGLEVVAPSACSAIPSHQVSEPEGPSLFGFALNSVRGEVAVFGGDGKLVDEEPSLPGFSFIPVGALAEDLETSSDGKDVYVTVGSSCDLARISVAEAALGDHAGGAQGQVARIKLRAGGTELAARPADLAMLPAPLCLAATSATTTPSPRCALLTLPGCGALGLVALETGEVLSAMSLDASVATDRGSALSCAAECGGTAVTGGTGGGVDPEGAPAPRPMAVVERAGGGARVYVGLSNAEVVWAIDVGGDGKLVAGSARRIVLAGARGVLKLRASGPVLMQGAPARFLYAVTRDGTVRVLRIDTLEEIECDTQVDPRLLTVQAQEARICTPVSLGLRRRASATGPGLRLPGGDLPRDVAFASVDNLLPQELAGLTTGRIAWSPIRLNGEFAFIAGSRARVYTVNLVDRDALSLHPGDIAATRAHQLRSGVAGQYDTDGTPVFRSQGVPRATLVVRIDDTGAELVADAKAPDLRKVLNADGLAVPHPVQRLPSEGGTLSVAEIEAERRATFPDLHELLSGDRWQFIFEGSLTAGVPRFGGNIRTPINDTGVLEDATAPFCAMGVQPGDILVLRGCTQPSDCAPGSTCTNNLGAPAGLPGLCFPGSDDDRKRLSAECADVMITGRRYQVREASATRLVFGTAAEPHPRHLVCTADTDCPSTIDQTTGLMRSFACESAPAPSGLRHCEAKCASSGECGSGFVCDLGRGRCTAGGLPRPGCFPELQRYEVRVGDALYASRAGGVAQHRVVADAGGQCVIDGGKSPLLQNRVPRNPPACAAGVEGPCLSGGAVRFENPSLHFDFTGMSGEIPTGYLMEVEIGGGFGSNGADLDSPLPFSMERAPDSFLYIVQSGDNGSGGRGVVQRIQPQNVSRDRNFIIR